MNYLKQYLVDASIVDSALFYFKGMVWEDRSIEATTELLKESMPYITDPELVAAQRMAYEFYMRTPQFNRKGGDE